MTNRKDWPLALSVGPAAMNGEAFDALASAGIRELELSSGAIDPFYSVLDFPRRANEIAAEAKAHGVTISSIHLPFGPFSKIDPASPDPEVRKYILSVQSELIGAAGGAGIGKAIIHPSGEPYREEERGERIACAVGMIGKLTDVAKSAGVTLCLENLPRTCLCRTSDEMRVFLNAIPDLRVVFDTNHSLRENNVHYIHAVGDRIVSLHVSDYDFIDEKHWLPLEGKNDWPAIVAALEEVGYGGRFLYELHAGYTYEQIAENCRALLG